MKTLVLNGSPKRDASDTMHITRAFLDGMQQAGEQQIKFVNIIDKHIGYCKGCFTCMHNAGKCVQDDDMRELLCEVLEATRCIATACLHRSKPLWTALCRCQAWQWKSRVTDTVTHGRQTIHILNT